MNAKQSKRTTDPHPRPRNARHGAPRGTGEAEATECTRPDIARRTGANADSEVDAATSKPPDAVAFEVLEGGTIQFAAPASEAEQDAYLLFRDWPEEDLDAVGIDIVEGECPGSTYFAAELRGDIAAANAAARERGLGVWFFKSV